MPFVEPKKACLSPPCRSPPPRAVGRRSGTIAFNGLGMTQKTSMGADRFQGSGFWSFEVWAGSGYPSRRFGTLFGRLSSAQSAGPFLRRYQPGSLQGGGEGASLLPAGSLFLPRYLPGFYKGSNQGGWRVMVCQHSFWPPVAGPRPLGGSVRRALRSTNHWHLLWYRNHEPQENTLTIQLPSLRGFLNPLSIYPQLMSRFFNM